MLVRLRILGLPDSPAGGSQGWSLLLQTIKMPVTTVTSASRRCLRAVLSHVHPCDKLFCVAGYKAALLVPSLWMFGLVVIASMLVEWLWWRPGASFCCDA